MRTTCAPGLWSQRPASTAKTYDPGNGYHCACSSSRQFQHRRPYLQAIKLLLMHGSSAHTTNKYGHTPVELASSPSAIQILQSFESEGDLYREYLRSRVEADEEDAARLDAERREALEEQYVSHVWVALHVHMPGPDAVLWVQLGSLSPYTDNSARIIAVFTKRSQSVSKGGLTRQCPAGSSWSRSSWR